MSPFCLFVYFKHDILLLQYVPCYYNLYFHIEYIKSYTIRFLKIEKLKFKWSFLAVD
jgi:hypothetical protein